MTKIYLCESEFEFADHDNPKYSQMEADVFAFIPNGYYLKKQKEARKQHKDPKFIAQIRTKEPSFSLSVRKNLETGEYELFKWHQYEDSDKAVVLASKNIEEVFKKATEMWHYYWDDLDDDIPNSTFAFLVCKHEYPAKAIGCRVNLPVEESTTKEEEAWKWKSQISEKSPFGNSMLTVRLLLPILLLSVRKKLIRLKRKSKNSKFKSANSDNSYIIMPITLLPQKY